MLDNIKEEIVSYGGIKQYLYAQQEKILLRFLTCGNVDDGKSTLIGRLLHDTHQIYEDQLSVLYKEIRSIDDKNKKLDLASLLDGLQLERAQGITIDVAYRFFFTKKRKFIIADTPGHLEYTKNMVTGASTSELAVLLIDARKGIQHQTKRHWFISALLGIKHIVIAINKMDLINYNKKIFQDISKEFLEFAKKLYFKTNIQFIPISALDGDNIATTSINMKWYKGPTLLEVLDNINIKNVGDWKQQKLRFPIQYVIRNNSGFRGYSGTIASGSIHTGQLINTFPSNNTAQIQRIIVSSSDVTHAYAGEAITVTLNEDLDISRGDMLVDINSVSPARDVLINIIWMHTEALKEGQYFNVKIATKLLKAQVLKIECKINVDTFQYQKTNSISLNEIGLIKLSFDELLILDKYSDSPMTGSMIFIDLLTNETVGAGMIDETIKYNPIYNKYNRNYSKFELELHSFIRLHFPHWGIKDLS
ncbi:sulfate adenylyltransferase subunit CysN [Candidatus Blochmannia ocreatus (nom. nud.)]|uniref:sulfate adenylyltransferase n=1 Tax=Candidatus Blochmannia ocreatus (nom. nud.) TaxID=251538 RepID=A0ABY4SW76_9ENTR|nr:sulfate adenylyltransferase subunit CysN [Candidatus Blochmannia ocreatus]URJ25245.1 sulfate adenylyltransferase subunit CysN [Candidatus Blochmannia ocreatus]